MKRLGIRALLIFLIIISFSAPSFAIEARVGDSEVTISWIPPTKNEDGTPLIDLAGYNIYRSEYLSNEFVKINEEPVRGICYTDTGLINGISYIYAVTALDTCGHESKKSPYVTAIPSIMPPSKLRIKPGNAQIELFWDPYEKSPIKGYHVYRKGGAEDEFKRQTAIPVQDNFFTDSNVKNGIPFFYKIRCIGEDGIEGLPSEVVGATPMAMTPGELSSVKARYIHAPDGEKYVEIQWEEIEDNEIIGYKIYRRLLTESDFTQLTDEVINTKTFRDYSALLNRGYLYSVVAVNQSRMETQYPREIKCFTSEVFISNVSNDAKGRAVKGGDRVCFLIKGEPDAKAYIKIEDLLPQPLLLEEIERGEYYACLEIKQEMTLDEGKVIGILEDKLGNSAYLTASDRLTIDNQPPYPVKTSKAEEDSGSIKISWEPPDGEYSLLELIREEVMGNNIEAEGRSVRQIPNGQTTYYDIDIKPGRSYKYTLYTIDRAGNRSISTDLGIHKIAFESGITLIESIKDNTSGLPLKTGDKIEIEVKGERGAKAIFLFHNIFDMPLIMQEIEPGTYRGIYFIRAEDRSNQAFFEVCLTDIVGNKDCEKTKANLFVNWEIEDKDPPRIEKILHNAFEVAGFSGNLVPGNTLDVRIKGEAACWACFAILPKDAQPGNMAADDLITLILHKTTENQDAPGIYSGSYTIDWKDTTDKEAYIWGCLVDWGGNRVWQKCEEPLSIDTRPRIKVEPDKDILYADQISETDVRINVTDANEYPVEGHHIVLTLTTTEEYTGVVGGGDFGRDMTDTIRIDDSAYTTDSMGEVEIEYNSGFSAKTALIVAKDLTTGHTGAGYILNYIKAETDILLEPPSTLLRYRNLSGYRLILTSDPERLTADGISSSWISARIVDSDDRQVDAEGVSISLYLESRNGTLSDTHAKTDGSGEANIRYTAGIIRGTVTITAVAHSADSRYNNASGSVDIVLMSDAPAKISIEADTNFLIANGLNTSRISVRVKDINDNDVQQAMIEFSIIQNGLGSLDTTTKPTDFNGKAECIYTAPDLKGKPRAIATILSKATSRIPKESELKMAIGTIFVPSLYPEMEPEEEVRILEWKYKKGDMIKEGAPLVRIETKKGEKTINAPVSGRLSRISLHRGEKAQLGETLGLIEADEQYLFLDE